jgi:hypothetical protein
VRGDSPRTPPHVPTRAEASLAQLATAMQCEAEKEAAMLAQLVDYESRNKYPWDVDIRPPPVPNSNALEHDLAVAPQTPSGPARPWQERVRRITGCCTQAGCRSCARLLLLSVVPAQMDDQFKALKGMQFTCEAKAHCRQAANPSNIGQAAQKLRQAAEQYREARRPDIAAQALETKAWLHARYVRCHYRTRMPTHVCWAWVATPAVHPFIAATGAASGGFGVACV